MLDRTTHVAVVVVVLAIIGTGVGLVFQPTLVALQAHVPSSRRAVITSNRNFFRCAGGACGLAVSAAVLQTTLRAHLPPRLDYLAGDTYALLAETQRLGRDDDREAVLDAYMAASHAVFVLQVPLMGACLLGCLLVRDRGLQRPEDEDDVVCLEQGRQEAVGAGVRTQEEEEDVSRSGAQQQGPSVGGEEEAKRDM